MEPRPKALFLSHGGGPCFFMQDGSSSMKQMNKNSDAAKWYRGFTRRWPKPSAIVIVSAHWEARHAVRVTSAAKHPLFFDYYGFPDYTYDLEYDCPGHPALAGRIVRLLRDGGIPAVADGERGYDHGVFIPLKLMYPDADVPVVQVSLLAGLSAENHLKIGEALRALMEDEGILLIGSGQATHGMQSFYPGYGPGEAAPREGQFISWLKDTATNEGVGLEERRRRLARWSQEAPYGRLAHPREEHLLPLHVVSGCTAFLPGKVLYDGWVTGGMSLACVGYWGRFATSGGARSGATPAAAAAAVDA